MSGNVFRRSKNTLIAALLLGFIAAGCASASSDAATDNTPTDAVVEPEVEEVAPSDETTTTTATVEPVDEEQEEPAQPDEAEQTEEAATSEPEESAEAPAEPEEPAEDAAPTTTEEPPADEPEAEEPAEAEQPDEPAPPVEEPAAQVSPLFEGSFVDLNGESIDLASFEGQDVVLWFWAPW